MFLDRQTNKFPTQVIFPSALGVVLGVVGATVMGYVAAIAVPQSFYLWFDSQSLPLFFISIASQFLAFGILALLVGFIIGRVSKRWLLSCMFCYLSFLLTVTVGVARFYDAQVESPFVGSALGGYFWLESFVVPCCLFLMARLYARRHRYSIRREY